MDNHTEPIDSLRERLLTLRQTINDQTGKPYRLREIKKEFYPGNVSFATIGRIIRDPDYEPINEETREALNLPIYRLTEVCPIHKVVHKGRCPTPRYKRRRRTPPVRIGETTNGELEKIYLLSPAERKKALLTAAEKKLLTQ